MTEENKVLEEELEVTVEDADEAPAKPEAPKAEEGAEGKGRDKVAKDDDDDELAGYSEKVKKRIDKLTYKAREAQRERDAALELARAIKEDNEVAKRERVKADKRFATEYENRLKIQERLVSGDLRAAIDAGDSESQIKLQRELSALQVELGRVAGAKANIDTFAKQNNIDLEKDEPVRPVQRQEPQPQQPQVKPSAKAEAWAEKNEWFGQDETMTQAAFIFHKDIIEEGVEPDSDEYYEEIDNRLRAAFPKKLKAKAREEEDDRRPVQAVAGARPGAVTPGKKKVQLTKSQAEIARKLGVPYDEYYRHLQALKK